MQMPEPTTDTAIGYDDATLDALFAEPLIPYLTALMTWALDAADDETMTDAATGEDVSLASLTILPPADRCAFCHDVLTDEDVDGWVCESCFAALDWEGDDAA